MNLLGEDFIPSTNSESVENTSLNSDLLNLQWPTNSDMFNSNFMPSNFILEGSINFNEPDLIQADDKVEPTETKDNGPKKNLSEKNNAQMSWLSLFAELDPLANQDIANAEGDRA